MAIRKHTNFVCTRVHIQYICPHVWIYSKICTYVRTYVCACPLYSIPTCIHMDVCNYVYVCMYTHTYLHVCMYTYVHMCVSMFNSLYRMYRCILCIIFIKTWIILQMLVKIIIRAITLDTSSVFISLTVPHL